MDLHGDDTEKADLAANMRTWGDDRVLSGVETHSTLGKRHCLRWVGLVCHYGGGSSWGMVTMK